MQVIMCSILLMTNNTNAVISVEQFPFLVKLDGASKDDAGCQSINNQMYVSDEL